MNKAYLSIGSNIDDRLHHLTEAVRALHSHEGLTVVVVSSIYETAPVGYTDQADFLNIVVQVSSSLNAFELLEVCQEIEQGLGRMRTIRWGPRTVDLDILLYNNESIETENLIVPHPRMHERAFVLIPLVEIAPDVDYPLNGELVMDDAGVSCWKKINGVEEFLAM